VLTLLRTATDYSPFLQQRETTLLRQRETTQNFSEQGYMSPLSIDELCAVHLATIREGVNHCRWPREVIERFLAVVV
jgi:hypothetical protein